MHYFYFQPIYTYFVNLWSETAVSKQCGAAILLRRLAEKKEIVFPDSFRG